MYDKIILKKFNRPLAFLQMCFALQYITQLVFYVFSCILSVKDTNSFKLYININNIYRKNINITTTIIRAEIKK